MDVGLKYRFFNVSNLKFSEGGTVRFDLDGRLRTHSLLLSLIYNFARAAAAASAAASAASAAAAASGDADVPGRLGDPGDGRLSGSAASAAAAAAGARARLTRAQGEKKAGPGITPGPVFFCPAKAATTLAALRAIGQADRIRSVRAASWLDANCVGGGLGPSRRCRAR